MVVRGIVEGSKTKIINNSTGETVKITLSSLVSTIVSGATEVKVYKVYIPVFSRGRNKFYVEEALVSNIPGLKIEYKKDDAVFVSFEENDLKKAFIVGKLSNNLDNNDELTFNAVSANKITTKQIYVKEKAEINSPKLTGITEIENIKLGNKAESYIKSIAKEANSENNSILQKLQSSVTSLFTTTSTIKSSVDATEQSSWVNETKHFTKPTTKTKNINWERLGWETNPKKTTGSTKIDIPDPINIGTLNQLKDNTQGQKLYRWEVELFPNDWVDSKPYKLSIKIPFSTFISNFKKDLIDKICFINIDNSYTALNTDQYSISPGYYTQLLMKVKNEKGEIEEAGETPIVFDAWVQRDGEKEEQNNICISLSFARSPTHLGDGKQIENIKSIHLSVIYGIK